MMGDLLLFNSRSAALVKRRRRDGKEFLVVPTVALVAGILKDELVPADEIGTYPDAWAGIPVVLGHPENGAGENISANDPDTLAKVEVGRFFYPDFDGKKLRGQIWVDLEKTERLGGDAAEMARRFKSGQTVEVSTAYFRDLENKSGSFNGHEYVGVQRNLRPDHLAVLLHDVGACSVADGCGAPRVNKEVGMNRVSFTVFGMIFNILSRARRPRFSGTEEISWADVAKTFDAFASGFYRHTDATRPDEPIMRVEDAPQAMKNWIASKTLLGDPDADNVRDLIFFPVVNPTTDNLNAGAVRAVLGGRGALADIPASARESAQEVARSLLEAEFQTEQRQTNSIQETVKEALDSLRAMLTKINLPKENAMSRDEMIRAIFEDGRLRLSMEQLEGMADDAITSLHEFVAGDQANENDSDSDASDDGQQQNVNDCDRSAGDSGNQDAEQDDSPAPAVNTALQSLATEIEKRGGVGAVMQVLDGLQANTDKERDRLIAQLIANSRCALTKEQLQAMSTDVLEGLQRSICEQVDFAGLGAVVATNAEELTPLTMEDVFAPPKAQAQKEA